MRTPAALVSALALAALSLSPLACTGQVFEEGTPNHGDDAGTDATPGDAGPGNDSSPPANGPCPTSAPALGSACAVEDLQCEYGQSEYPGCDNLVQCLSGSWQADQENQPCPPSNAGSCPPTMAAAKGQPCDPAPNGTVSCFYPTGGCYCGFLGGPTPIDLDGAIPAQTWQCDDPGPGCPIPRPRIGAPCDEEGVSCQYQECAYAESCSSGLWNYQPEGCAVAGSSGP